MIRQVSRVQGGGASNSTTVASPAQAHTAARLLVALVHWTKGSSNFSAISDTAGNTWTQAGAEFVSGTRRLRLYYAWNCLGHATNVVTVAWTTVSSDRAIVVHEFSGVLATSDPLSAEATGAGGGTAIASGTLAQVASEEVIIALARAEADQLAPGAGFTGVTFAITGESSALFLDEYRIAADAAVASAVAESAVNVSATATCAQGAWLIKAAAFRAAAAASFDAADGRFEDWLASPDRDDITLLELTPALHLTSWTQLGSPNQNTYSTPLARQELAAVVEGGLYRRVDGVRQDGTALTERATIADVQANPGSWYWDDSAGTLYVRTTTGAPTSFTMSALVTFYVATQPIVLNRTDGAPDTGLYYHPWLAAGAPTLSQERENLFSGAKIAATGQVVVTNAHGIWNTLVAPDSAYHWRNKRARLFIGGRYNGLSLPRSRYAAIATVLVEGVQADERTCVFAVKTYARQTEITLPVTPYFESTYPHLGDGVRGKKKPIIYGRCVLAPDLTDAREIDDPASYGVYTIADAAYQTLFAANAVYAVDKTTGARTLLTLTTDYTVNLTACTVTIVNQAYTHTDYSLVVDVTGKPDGAGSYLRRAGAIIKDLLQTFLGVAATDIDAAAFTQADLDADAELAIALTSERTLASILATEEPDQPSIERSVLGSLQQTLDGKWTFRIFSPWYQAATAVAMRKEEFASFAARTDIEARYATARVTYGRDYALDQASVSESTDAAAQYLDDAREAFTLHTYLRFQNDADVLRRRYVFLTEQPTTKVAFTERGSKLATKVPGQKVLVTHDPAPTAAGKYADTVFELTAIRRAPASPLQISGELELIRQLNGRAGTWADSAAPSWASATAAQRLASGFWCDTNNRADPADSASANVSLWW